MKCLTWHFYNTKSTQINAQVLEAVQPPIRGTCSCLGQPCPRFPSDENIISKLAVAVYTNKGGPVEDRHCCHWCDLVAWDGATGVRFYTL